MRWRKTIYSINLPTKLKVSNRRWFYYFLYAKCQLLTLFFSILLNSLLEWRSQEKVSVWIFGFLVSQYYWFTNWMQAWIQWDCGTAMDSSHTWQCCKTLMGNYFQLWGTTNSHVTSNWYPLYNFLYNCSLQRMQYYCPVEKFCSEFACLLDTDENDLRVRMVLALLGAYPPLWLTFISCADGNLFSLFSLDLLA